MFRYANEFDQDLGDWDVSNVKDMSQMFHGAGYFRGKGLKNWNVSNVENMAGMFRNDHFDYRFGGCDFSEDIGDWDVSNVKDMVSCIVVFCEMVCGRCWSPIC
mmetsp:Transcript_2576/g.5844  ORF Transcript_2576/g.5844 Transcript_2576/m.5844 type:complete len:103 (-) Transcript_2576:877-1185(-)